MERAKLSPRGARRVTHIDPATRDNGVAGIVSHVFLKSDLPAGASFHLGLRSESTGAYFEVLADPVLPDGAESNADGSIIV